MCVLIISSCVRLMRSIMVWRIFRRRHLCQRKFTCEKHVISYKYPLTINTMMYKQSLMVLLQQPSKYCLVRVMALSVRLLASLNCCLLFIPPNEHKHCYINTFFRLNKTCVKCKKETAVLIIRVSDAFCR